MEPTPTPTPEQPQQVPAPQPVTTSDTAQVPSPVPSTPQPASVGFVPASPVQQNAGNYSPTNTFSPSATEPVNQTHDAGHGLGVASLITSLLGFSLVGVILGFIAMSKSKKTGHKNTLGLVGVIVGLIGIVIGALIFVGLILNNFQGAQAKARDTQSITRMNSLYAQLEVFYNEKAYYPQTLSADLFPGIDPLALNAPDGSRVTSGGGGVKSEQEALAMYPPDEATPYQYNGFDCADGKCKGYVLKVHIEKPSTIYPDPYIKRGLQNP